MRFSSLVHGAFMRKGARLPVLPRTRDFVVAALGATFLFLLPLLTPGYAFATPAQQAQPVKVTASGGFGDEGYYVLGEWLPVRVTVDNPTGGTAHRVRVQANISETTSTADSPTFGRDIELPPRSNKALTLYVFATAFARSVRVSVLEDGATLASTQAVVSPLEGPANSVLGIVSADRSTLAALSGEQFGHGGDDANAPNLPSPGGSRIGTARATIARLTLDDIPDRADALNSLGVLVLDDASTRKLSDSASRALGAWATAGGTLILAGGDPSGLGDVAPVRFEGTAQLPLLTSLTALTGSALAPVTTVTLPAASVLNPSNTRVLALQKLDGQNPYPLVAVREVGSGQVAYIGLPLSSGPLKGWEGTLPLVRRLLDEHRTGISQGAARRGLGVQGRTLGGDGTGLFSLPGLELPEPALLGGFLLIYILVIGPLNFIVLRRLRRVELAWATVPAIVLLFSIGAYALGYGAKGGDVVALRASVTSWQLGERTLSTTKSYLGLFSPSRRMYSIASAAGSLPYEVAPYGYGSPPGGKSFFVIDGDPVHVESVLVDTWSMRAFAAGQSSEVSPVPFKADLHTGLDSIEGAITNNTGEELQDVAVWRGGATQYIGTLQPGGSAAVKLSATLSLPDSGTIEKLLPAPRGVTKAQYTRPAATNRDDRAAQEAARLYGRRLDLLNDALMGERWPELFSVTAVGWSGTARGRMEISGAPVKSEEVAVLEARLAVSRGENSRLSGTSIPVSVFVPEAQPRTQTPPLGDIIAGPISDATFRLPPGTKPVSLKLRYHLAVPGPSADALDILALNRTTGAWDKLPPATDQSGDGVLEIPGPNDYVGPAGDVVMRLVLRREGGTVRMPLLEMSQN